MDTANDKLLKVAQNQGWQLGSGGVIDASTTTFPMVNVINLPTITPVEVTIDRVDANGSVTPTKMERCTCEVSGGQLINCVRGEAGTAQAHNAGAVVEVLIDATYMNKMVDAVKLEHNPDGTHKSTLISDNATFLTEHSPDGTHGDEIFTDSSIFSLEHEDDGTHKVQAIHEAAYVEDTGGDDTYAVAIPNVTAYFGGLNVKVKVTTANTGVATLDVNSLGAIAIKKMGDSGLEDLADGDIKAEQVVEMTYDGSVFQLQTGGSATIVEDAWHYVGDSGEPSFENSWVNQGDTNFEVLQFKRDNNIIYVKGFIKNGTVGGSYPIFTLPVDYRPLKTRLLSGIDNSYTLVRLEVRSNGELVVYNGSNGWQSIEIIFKI